MADNNTQWTVSPPALSTYVKISFPAPQVLLVTMDRGYNMLNMEMQRSLSQVWQWYDTQPALRCAIVTGTKKAFCAGADLKEWLATKSASPDASKPGGGMQEWGEVRGGFGGMSRRTGKKPIIGAIGGLCLGGGMEMAVNCDMIVASTNAEFGFPEVKRGVFVKAGGLGRLVAIVGFQRASELVLIGDSFSAQEALSWGIVNHVVEPENVVAHAIAMAEKVARNSPDSVIVSRRGLLLALENGSLERGTQLLNESLEVHLLEQGENQTEGLTAFKQKRATRWVNSKL